MREVEVAVVGAGVMGSATAWALARGGHEVLLLERLRVGHARGSSHGTSRVFRFAYPVADLVALAMEARTLWRELEREVGRTLLVTLGGFDRGKPLEPYEAALGACGAAFELMSAQDVRARFPFMRMPEGETVLYQPDAGIVLADRAVRSFVEAASAHGSVVAEDTLVTALEPGDDHVVLRTDGGSIGARVAVVTAGSWARGVLATAGIELPVVATRETVAYFGIDEALRIPPLVEGGEPGRYALPSPDHGLKTAEDHAGPPTDPDREGVASEESVARLTTWVRERFPGAEPRPHLVETCLYTNTADERFVLERHGPIVVGSPCSGHGFKFAPAIGRRLAALVSGDQALPGDPGRRSHVPR